MSTLRASLLTLLASLACACSSSLPLDDKQTTQEDALVLAPCVAPLGAEGSPMMSTRATYYDGQHISFTWEVYDDASGKGDVLGIVPLSENDAQQMRFACKSVSKTAEEGEGGLSQALFKQEDANFAWTAGKKYRAYYPYNKDAQDVTAIPLDYTGQCQTGKPDMEDYYQTTTKDKYYATERSASAHLSEKSFLISDEATAVSNKSLPFKMSYLCGIVRLYLALPTDVNAEISEIRLVATKAVFHEHATLNMRTGETATAGNATNNLLLQLREVNLPGTTVYSNYLVAYMMAHPVELTDDAVLGTTGKLYIYAKGKMNGEDVYFRSGSITKKDIKAGSLTQFSVKPTAKDEPIDVQPITVQEWQEGLTLTNGEDGKGTGNW